MASFFQKTNWKPTSAKTTFPNEPPKPANTARKSKKIGTPPEKMSASIGPSSTSPQAAGPLQKNGAQRGLTPLSPTHTISTVQGASPWTERPVPSALHFSPQHPHHLSAASSVDHSVPSALHIISPQQPASTSFLRSI